jgi:transcriptional regulator with XRE-family HTH domain
MAGEPGGQACLSAILPFIRHDASIFSGQRLNDVSAQEYRIYRVYLWLKIPNTYRKGIGGDFVTMNNPRYKIGAAFRRCRLQQGLTLDQCAELLEISPRYLSNIELDNNVCSSKVLFRAAELLHFSLDDILAGREPDEGQGLRNSLYALIDRCPIEALPAALDVMLALQKHW